MPRSGTTLIEQIIASHSQIHGAGELHEFLEIAQRSFPGDEALGFPENLINLNADTLTELGKDYIKRMRRHNSTALHITDKMPTNYLALGLIHLMLPNAKIIHVVRNPVDTCLSCFTRLFNRHQFATYDLAELGEHYMNYYRLMEHWRKVLPLGSFIDIRYEDIIEDIEGQARYLINYLDIDWEQACLDFYQNERRIRTASVIQVRQPIYSSSVGRWRHYKKYLQPLLDKLQPII